MEAEKAQEEVCGCRCCSASAIICGQTVVICVCLDPCGTANECELRFNTYPPRSVRLTSYDALPGGVDMRELLLSSGFLSRW